MNFVFFPFQTSLKIRISNKHCISNRKKKTNNHATKKINNSTEFYNFIWDETVESINLVKMSCFSSPFSWHLKMLFKVVRKCFTRHLLLVSNAITNPYFRQMWFLIALFWLIKPRRYAVNFCNFSFSLFFDIWLKSVLKKKHKRTLADVHWENRKYSFSLNFEV